MISVGLTAEKKQRCECGEQVDPHRDCLPDSDTTDLEKIEILGECEEKNKKKTDLARRAQVDE